MIRMAASSQQQLLPVPRAPPLLSKNFSSHFQCASRCAENQAKEALHLWQPTHAAPPHAVINVKVLEWLVLNILCADQELRRHLKREFAKLLTLLQAYAIISTGVRIICTNQVKFLCAQSSSSACDFQVNVVGE